MATEVISTIRSSGGDYTTLSAWEAGEQGNLVTADEIRTAECYNDWASGMTSGVTVAGWTTDSTRYPKITVASGHRHGGIPQAGFFISAAVNYGAIITSSQVNAVFEYLDVRNTGTTDDCYGFANSVNALFLSCIARGHTTNGSSGFRNTSSGGTYRNCLAYSSNTGFRFLTYSGVVYNCVSANNTTGFAQEYEGCVLKNCVAYGGTTQYTGTWNAASSHNATSAGSDNAPGANSVISVGSSAFVSAAGNNFHLASGSVLIGAGTNLYSTFTTDIDGDTWPSSGAWNIGFDYYEIAASAPSITALSAINITATSAQPRISYS